MSARGRLQSLVLFTALLIAGPSSRPEAQLQDVAERAVDSVFLVGVSHSNGSFEEVGTAWTIAENKLATNAHVAEALLAGQLLPGDRMIALRGLLDRNEVVLGDVLFHPAYYSWNGRLRRMLIGRAAQLKTFDVIAVADVAIIDVIAGDTGAPLECAMVAEPSHEPRLGDPIMYLGYPMENLSGFATLHAVVGNVTAKTDFFFMRASWPESFLLHFSGPTTGGASGSPVLDSRGRVIGLLSAAEHLLTNEGEARVSFGFTYAQRVDLAVELIDGTYVARQAERDRAWAARAYDLFMKPGELIQQLVGMHTDLMGVAAASVETVTERQDTLSDAETSRRTRVVMEPGYRYGFLSVAHDGTDIDAGVSLSDGTSLGVDVRQDQYPVVWLEPVALRTEAFFEVHAAQALLLPTPVSVRVVRYDSALTQATAPEPTGAEFWTETFVATVGGQNSYSYPFELDPAASYTFSGNSGDLHDIDLYLYRGEEVIASDALFDWFPAVTISGVSGEVRLELRVPESMQVGNVVTLLATRAEGTGGAGGTPIGVPVPFWEEVFHAAQSGAHTVTWTVNSLADKHYRVTATSLEQLDIDLRILSSGLVIVEDRLLDSFPIVEFDGTGAEITVELVLPATAVEGSEVNIIGFESPLWP